MCALLRNLRIGLGWMAVVCLAAFSCLAVGILTVVHGGFDIGFARLLMLSAWAELAFMGGFGALGTWMLLLAVTIAARRWCDADH